MILFTFAILLPPYTSSQFDLPGRMADLVPSVFRIVKGQPCSVRDHPYMISLQLAPAMRHFCGGTLLSPGAVLTAAHCIIDFENNPGDIWAVAGLTEDEPSDIQMRRVRSVHIPRSYSTVTMVGDIGILVVDSAFVMDDFVHPVAIYPYRSTDVVKFCPRGQIMGWGSTSSETRGVEEPVLRCAVVPVLSHSKCQQHLHLFMDRSKICALGQGEDACIGDSGGPMMCGGVQIGIISSGHGCGAKNHPGVYTRVDYYFKYITRIVNAQSRCFDGKLVVFSVTACLASFIIDF